MKRLFFVGGSLLGTLLVGATLWLFWASSGRLPPEALATTKTYTEASPVAPDTLTVMTYNIGYLSGMTNNEPVVRSDRFLSENLRQALTLIRRADPDLIGFQEIDYGAARSGYVHQLDTIATALDYAEAAQAVNWDKRYIPFPYGRPAVHFGRTLSGQALLSRFPIQDHARNVLARPPQWIGRDAFYLDRLAQIAVLDLGNTPVIVINVHLEAFDQDTREKQAREVRRYYDQLVRTNIPVLLLGDFNSELQTGGSGTAPLADSTLHILLHNTELQPALPDSVRRATRTPAGTFPADTPTRHIDHIFYPPTAFERVDQRIACGTPSPPADHCAVTASFRLANRTAWPSPETRPRLDTLLVE